MLEHPEIQGLMIQRFFCTKGLCAENDIKAGLLHENPGLSGAMKNASIPLDWLANSYPSYSSPSPVGKHNLPQYLVNNGTFNIVSWLIWDDKQL